MLDTSSYALALVGDKEHQACRYSARPVACPSQENPELHSNHRSNFKHGCVGVHFGVAVLFQLTAELNIQSRTSASSNARSACSTAQELRTCAAAYAQRSA